MENGQRNSSNKSFEKMLKQFMKTSNQNKKCLESFFGERKAKKAKRSQQRQERSNHKF
jgi:hypothetical protein